MIETNTEKRINSKKEPQDTTANITPENVLVCGGIRDERMTNYVEPAILNSEGSLVITDLDGQLYRRYKEYLTDKGYAVKKIDFHDMDNSVGFNLFQNLKSYGGDHEIEDGITRIVTSLYKVRSKELLGDKPDSFFELLAQALLKAIICYITYHCLPRFSDFDNVEMMLDALKPSDDKDENTVLDYIFEQLQETCPDSPALKYYKVFSNISGNLLRRAQLIAWKTLDGITSDNVNQFMAKNDFEIEDLANEKIALFVIAAGEDDTYHGLTNAIVTEIMYKLLDISIKVPVQFIVEGFAPGAGIVQLRNIMCVLKRANISLLSVHRSLREYEQIYSDVHWLLGGYSEIHLLDGPSFLAYSKLKGFYSGEYVYLDVPLGYEWRVKQEHITPERQFGGASYIRGKMGLYLKPGERIFENDYQDCFDDADDQLEMMNIVSLNMMARTLEGDNISGTKKPGIKRPSNLTVKGPTAQGSTPVGEKTFDSAKEAPRTINGARYRAYMNQIKNKKIDDERAEARKRQRSADTDFDNVYCNIIAQWLEKTTFNEFSAEIHKRVKGQDQLDTILINIYNYLENMARGHFHSNNIIIAAPSGCGKTETYRALKAYFAKELSQLPIAQVDMTSITEEGFKGRDTKAVIEPLMVDADLGGMGIIFLDEFDKRLIPSYDSGGGNVNRAVQSQLLTTIEGTNFPDCDIDTNLTMFIGLGAFDVCREKKSKVEKHIGFGAESEGGADHYEDITRADMIELGASYELLGRFGTVVNYHKLSDTVINEIIDGMVKDIGNSISMKVNITDGFREHLHSSANGKYGCRLIKSQLNDAAMTAYLHIQKNAVDKTANTLEITGPVTFQLSEVVTSP